ncbi:MAG: nucleotidyltransferase family protein [Dehalococcoidia bacterium]
MPTAAILLVAGESTRMGRPKALLPWGNTTLIEYQIRELRAAPVDDLVVVLGHAAQEIRPHVPAGVRVVVNAAYREGRASSLRIGAAALPDDADPIIVLNVDQPRPREVLAKLLEAHQEGVAAVTMPVMDGKRGHPPVLAGALLRELREASEEMLGLRGVLERHEGSILEVAFDSPVVRLDINTPADYERALAELGSGSP